MTPARSVLDVSGVPTVAFGHRSLLWWGTVGFMIIEGFTLLLTIASYLYLRTNEIEWPPGRTPAPDLWVPTLDAVLLLLVILPMRAVDKAAKKMDRAGVVRGLVIATLLTLVVAVLRWWTLLSINARWDAHAYASAAWGVVVLHSTLVVTDIFETGALAALFMARKAKRKHYPDASDAAAYQYFLSTIWVPVYLIVYWGPRVL